MSGWLKRYDRRRRELAQGADADLVRSNRGRYKLAFVLLGLGFLLVLLSTILNPSGIPHKVAVVLAGVLIVAGLAILRWASMENTFLNKPDPEDPPKIFRN
jgi:hypothetical protein